MLELRTHDEGGNSFSLLLNGKMVLCHSPEKPCVALGTELGRVVSHSGSFKIAEPNKNKRWLKKCSFDEATKNLLSSGTKKFASSESFTLSIIFDDILRMDITSLPDDSQSESHAESESSKDSKTNSNKTSSNKNVKKGGRKDSKADEESRIALQFSFPASSSERDEGEKHSETWHMFWLRLKAQAGEHIHGCGEQYAKLDLKGSRVPIWISEPGVGRNFSPFSIGAALKTKHFPKWYNTYFSMPSWVSSSGVYCHVQSSAYSEMDFRDADSTLLHVWEIPKQVIVGNGGDLKGSVSGLSRQLKRQKALPEWVYDGMWLGLQGGNTVCSTHLNKALQAGVRIGAIWCQDWEGIRMTSFGKQLFWAWKYDEKLYPELPEYIKGLKKKGVRYLAYINTFLTPRGPMYEEAKKRDFLVKDAQGNICQVYVPSDPGVLVDFTNPEAREWLKGIIKNNMIDIGLSGWMADFGEYIPHDAVLHNGQTGLAYHNQYPVDWAKLNYEAVKESGKEDEIVYFMRAGFAGSAQYTPAYWNGDQLVDWSKGDGLPTALMGSLSLGASGVGMVHSDIGGYTTASYKKRSKELLIRWAEYAAFTPTMRSHEGNRPDSNWHCWSDDETLKYLARMTKIYTSLKPYHMALNDEYVKTGLPPIRIPAMHFPDDEGLYQHPYQYMYGPDLFISPVIRKGKKEWKVRLPKGVWVHMWTGKEFSGGKSIKVEAPYGQPPVFYRRGTQWKKLFQEIGNV